MKRTFGLVIAVLGLCWMTALDPVTSQSFTTCEDFRYQEDAQAAWDRGEGRPQGWYVGMDADGDGIACESLPSKPITQQTWFWPGVGIFGVGIFGVGGIWWNRKAKGVAGSPSEQVLFATRSSRESALDQPSAGGAGQEIPETAGQKRELTEKLPVVNVTVQNHLTNNNSSHSKIVTKSLEDWRITPERAREMPYEDYLRSNYWRTVRRNNIARANGKCSDCGRSDQVLQVHHLSYEFLGREDDRFLVVLCAGCHEKRHDLPSPDGARAK